MTTRPIPPAAPARTLTAEEAAHILDQDGELVDLGRAIDLTHNGQGRSSEGNHARR